MKSLFAVALLCVLLPLTLQAQSGRNRTKEASPTAPKPSTATSEIVDGSESEISATGETIEGDVLRVDTSLVTVPVSVSYRSGQYVPNLRREDFRLFEDGIEQKIAYFATVNQPFTVILLIDTSGSTKFRLEDIQEAALDFVSKLKQDDSVMIISFDDRIDVLSQPTTDRTTITRAIRRTRTGGGTRLYDAVNDVLTKHLPSIAGRKAVVLFTDGVDTTSRRGSFENTLHAAEESDAPFYVVDYDTSGINGPLGQTWPMPGGRGGIIIGIPLPRRGGTVPGSSPGDYRRASTYLHGLTDRTGGRFYSADSLMGISQAFSWIAEELGRQYSLGYYPKLRDVAGRDGQRRQIQVRVNQSDMVVRSRESYIYSERKYEPAQSGEKRMTGTN
jgi:VWFA-related protein